MASAAALLAAGASGARAQGPEVARESAGRHAVELGVTAGAIRVEQAFADGAEDGWMGTVGRRVAWSPVPAAALAVEAWRGELAREAGAASLAVTGVGAHLRVLPAAGRSWALEPALDFGILRLSADDDADRGLAFAAGGGLHHLARRWSVGVSLRNHHLRIEEGLLAGDDSPSVAVARDASLWEVRAELVIRLGGGGG